MIFKCVRVGWFIFLDWECFGQILVKGENMGSGNKLNDNLKHNSHNCPKT